MGEFKNRCPSTGSLTIQMFTLLPKWGFLIVPTFEGLILLTEVYTKTMVQFTFVYANPVRDGCLSKLDGWSILTGCHLGRDELDTHDIYFVLFFLIYQNLGNEVRLSIGLRLFVSPNHNFWVIV